MVALLWFLAQSVTPPPPIYTGMWSAGWTVLTVATAGGLAGIGAVILFIAITADLRARRRRRA